MSAISKRELPTHSFTQLREVFEQALETGDAETLGSILDGLADRVGVVVSARSVGDIAELRGTLARLRRRLGRHPAASEDLIATVKRFGVTLDSGLTTALLHAEATRRAEARVVLRQRILDALAHHGHMRPRELSELLDTSGPQISRCLKLLQADSQIETVPSTSGDGRAIEYRVRPVAAAAA